MVKNIEVEMRGPLDKKQFSSLDSFFHNNAKLKSVDDRFFIDYSTLLKGQGIRNRDIDIRIRAVNKIPEIIVKLGNWGDNRERKELSVIGKKGDFDKFVQIFAALGVKRGMLVHLKRKNYVYRSVEFALVEIGGGHSRIFEAEILVGKQNEIKKARQKIENVLNKLNLKVFTNEEFYKHIESVKNEAAELFDFKNYTEGYFRNRFNV